MRLVGYLKKGKDNIYSGPVLMKNIRDRFSKKGQTSNFVKIHPVGDVLFHTAEGHTDRQTDKTELIFAFRNFANAPNKQGECFNRFSCQFILSTENKSKFNRR